MFMRLESSMITMVPSTVTVHIIGKSDHSILLSDPTCHLYRDDKASGSAHSFRAVVHALKIYMTAIPVRIMLVADILRNLDISAINVVGTSEKIKARARRLVSLFMTVTS